MRLLFWLAPVLAIFLLDFVVLRGNSYGDKGIDRKPLVKKDDVELTVDNERLFYVAQVEIGSLKQKLEVLVDTGSSDLWVPSSNCSGDLYSYKKRDLDKRRVLNELELQGANDVQQKSPQINKDHPNKVNVVVDKVAAPEPTTLATTTKGANGVDKVYYYTTYYYTYYTNYYTNYYSYDDYSYDYYSTYYYTNTYSDYSQYLSAYLAYYLSYYDYYLSYDSYYYPTRTSGATYSDVSACTSYGTYETGKSDSAKLNATLGSFYINYGDGSYAYGEYFSDDVTIAGETVKGLNFAVCDSTDSEVGVLGIGLPALESSYYLGFADSSFSHQYENLPMALKLQGLIKKRLYSVSLGKNNALEGQVLFGAVDSSKYTGNLTRVKMINRYEAIGEKNPVYVEIALDSIAGTNLAVNYRTSVLLDTGASNNYLPLAYYNKIGQHLRGSESSYGYWAVSCDYLDLDEDLVFDFSGAKITVPIKSLIIESTTSSYCYLGIFEDNISPSLGDSFLRNAYVVYDLEDYEIALAQASDGDGDLDIEEVTSDIPNAVTAERFDFTSMSVQWTRIKSGSTSVFTLFTELFSNIAPSATPLTTDDSYTLESRSSFSYSTSVPNLYSYTDSSLTTAASGGGSTTVAGESTRTSSTSSGTGGSDSTVAGGDASKPSTQGPLYILLALLTILQLV